MHTALNSWADKLQQSKLPILAHSARELGRALRSPQPDLKALAGLIERDLGLSIGLLRTTNALEHKRLRAEVTTVEHALMMLGMERLKALPSSLPLLDDLKDPEIKQRLCHLYSRAHHAAMHAWEWARLRKDMVRDEVYDATLLYGLGEVVLWLHLPEKMRAVEALIRDKAIEPEEAHYVVLGFGIDHLSLELARRWGLPSLLQESLKSENAQNPRILGIMLAEQLARQAEKGWYRHEVTATLEQIADYLPLDFDQSVALTHQCAAEAARHDPITDVPAPAALLLQPAQPEAARDWEAESESGRQAGEAAGPSAEGDFCLTPQLHILRQSLNQLKDPGGAGLNLKQVVSVVMDGLHDGIGLNRVVFALLSTDKQRLVARAIAGADHDPVFKRFQVELDGVNLFSRLMDRPQAIWINDKNRKQFWPLVPQDFYRLTQCNDFMAISLHSGGKPVGLLYADRHCSACSLDTRAYHRFKQLGLQAAKAMAMVRH